VKDYHYIGRDFFFERGLGLVGREWRAESDEYKTILVLQSKRSVLLDFRCSKRALDSENRVF